MSEESEFPKKYYKKLKGLSFMEEVDVKAPEEIKKEIVAAEERMYNLDKEMEADLRLQEAKEKVKEYAAGYREVAALEKAKIKYCLFVMESRGYELDKKEDD
jgi:hypothetical protein